MLRWAMRLPISHRRAEQVLQVVARDVLGRVADDAPLWLGAGRKGIDIFGRETEIRQAVGDAGAAHQLDDAPGERFTSLARIVGLDFARFRAEALRGVNVPFRAAR